MSDVYSHLADQNAQCLELDLMIALTKARPSALVLHARGALTNDSPNQVLTHAAWPRAARAKGSG